MTHLRDRREPRLRELPVPARALVALVIAAAIAATAAGALLTAPRPLDATSIALVGVLCLVAAFFEVTRPGSSSLHPGLAFAFWAALVLPPAILPAVVALCFVPGAVRGRQRWYMAAYHGAAWVLAGLAADRVVTLAGLPVAGDAGPADIVAAAAAVLFFVVLVDALLVALVRVAWGRPMLMAARSLAANAPLELALTSTGAALAVLWTIDPWLSAMLAGPLGLVSRALLVPALRHKSRTDPKTGLFNFEHLRTTLDDAVRTAVRRDEPVAVVMVDLDHLRTINNRFGHLAGDQAILRVAGALGEAVQDRGVAARFGGEEFCVLLPGYAADAAAAVVDAVRQEVGDLWWESRGETMRCSFSAGVAAFPHDGETPATLLEAADTALYDAKAGGRNRVRLALAPDARADLDHDLRSAHAAGARTVVADAGPIDPEPAAAPVTAATPVPEAPAVAEPDDAEPVPASRRYIPAFVALLLAAAAATAVATAPLDRLEAPALLALLVVAVVALDLVRIDLFTGLNLSAASVPTITLACLFGPVGPMIAESCIALGRALRGEERVKWSFDLGALSLAGAAAALVYTALPHEGTIAAILAGVPAGIAYYVVNIGLMSVVIALSQGSGPVRVWRETLAWLWAHYLLYGILGAGLAVVSHDLGALAVAVFTLPIVTLWLAQRQHVNHSRATTVELRRSRDELEAANARLQRLLGEKRDLLSRVHGSYLSTITSLARTIEAKDPYTGGHTERVARVTLLLADELGLSEAERRAAEVGAAIHDIGKVGVPDEILLKPTGLSDAELAVMRRHPEISSYIVGALDVPAVVKEMVRNHHERYDGTGYPDRLAGEEIPLAARILAVADTLDAMTSDRPYRSARPVEDAIAEIEALSGRQFCPEVVAALRACLRRDAGLGGLFADREGRTVPADGAMQRAAA